MSRLSPLVLLVSVTSLLLAYGTSSWSWVAGPLSALALWGLERKAHDPSEPAAAHTGITHEPAPVD